MHFIKLWAGTATLAIALAAAGCTNSTVTPVNMSPSVAPKALPQIEGPVTGGERGMPYSTSVIDLAPFGYSENEYFISGVAHPYFPAVGGPLTEDGKWSVIAGAAVPYKTRILVRKPPAAKFNGTVIVEFMQEYFGTERDTNYRWNAETFVREGFGWVGVSLHHEGVDDSTPPKIFEYAGQKITMGMNLARWDPVRYGSLSLPSSDLSYDILTQVGRAVKSQGTMRSINPFADLPVRHAIAVGNTIAAERLSIYINAVQPREGVFDGFFLQDLNSGANLRLSKGVETPSGRVRVDTETPVVILNTTTAAAQQGPKNEGKKLRFWDPAGSSHTTGPYMKRVNDANQRDLGTQAAGCPVDYANTFPVQYVSGAAIVSLDRWIKGGPAVPSFPQLSKFSGLADPKPEPSHYFDEHGNVAGGLRTPWVDVPIARYDWRGECIGGSGRTFPFTAAELTVLYGTPAAYHARFAQSVRDAERRGVLLPQDAEAAISASRKVAW